MAASSRRSRSPLPLAHGSPSLSLQAIIQASRSDRPWAIITGASSGIGHALATEAARRGCNVVLVARRAAALADLAATLEQEHGALTQVVALDLARPESAEALHAATAPLAHRVELLVANAGRSWSGPLAAQPAEVSGCVLQRNGCRGALMLRLGCLTLTLTLKVLEQMLQLNVATVARQP